MSAHLLSNRQTSFELSRSLVDTSTVNVVKKDGKKFINQYEIIKDLGKGSFGKVKLVRHTETGELFALKVMNKNVLKKKRMGSSNLLQGVEHEIRVMKMLDHPNIIKLYEVIDSPDYHKLFLRLEYMEGGQCMHTDEPTDPLPEHIARKYFKDLMKGVDYMHSIGVIHRDIKPENLLLTKNNTVKLADFGTGQVVQDSDMINKSAVTHYRAEDMMMSRERVYDENDAGTPAFTAPEACVEGDFSGKAADVWACGVSLYIYLHGKCPFMSSNLVAIFQMIREDEPEFGSFLSANSRDLLEKMLDKRPDEPLKAVISEIRSGEHDSLQEGRYDA